PGHGPRRRLSDAGRRNRKRGAAGGESTPRRPRGRLPSPGGRAGRRGAWRIAERRSWLETSIPAPRHASHPSYTSLEFGVAPGLGRDRGDGAPAGPSLPLSAPPPADAPGAQRNLDSKGATTQPVNLSRAEYLLRDILFDIFHLEYARRSRDLTPRPLHPGVAGLASDAPV